MLCRNRGFQPQETTIIDNNARKGERQEEKNKIHSGMDWFREENHILILKDGEGLLK